MSDRTRPSSRISARPRGRLLRGLALPLVLLAVTAPAPASDPAPNLVLIGIPGDANADFHVGLDDFAILKHNFGATSGATWAMGDFNGDGRVDLDDFILLKENFGKTWDFLTELPDLNCDGVVDFRDLELARDLYGTYVDVHALCPKELTLDLGGGVTMDLMKIPAGTFMMGSPETEQDRLDREGPQRQVTLTQDFYMGVYPVTQAQYEAVMGTNPSHHTSSGPDAPVEQVSWHDAMAFCDALSLQTGRTVTLPTEAQWEYACRTGSTTRFYYGDDPDYSLLGDYAWFYFNSESKTHPVGQKLPNAWGLYDMHGNVWEWCRDWYASSYVDAESLNPSGPAIGSSRVRRGGSYGSCARCCRSAYRTATDPARRPACHGVRVVLLLAPMD